MSSDFRNEYLVVIFAFCQNTIHFLIFRNKLRVNNWDDNFSFTFQKKKMLYLLYKRAAHSCHIFKSSLFFQLKYFLSILHARDIGRYLETVFLFLYKLLFMTLTSTHNRRSYHDKLYLRVETKVSWKLIQTILLIHKKRNCQWYVNKTLCQGWNIYDNATCTLHIKYQITIGIIWQTWAGIIWQTLADDISNYKSCNLKLVNINNDVALSF